MTIYEMVRNKKLYPLETYLDVADLALTRDKANLPTFIKQLDHKDEGLRWWAIVGLHLLGDDAKSASKTLHTALKDEAHEIRMMAAWTLIKLSDNEEALASLEELLFKGTHNKSMLHNILDWMGEPALPLVKKYVDSGQTRKGRYGIGILGRVAELQGW